MDHSAGTCGEYFSFFTREKKGKLEIYVYKERERVPALPATSPSRVKFQSRWRDYRHFFRPILVSLLVTSKPILASAGDN